MAQNKDAQIRLVENRKSLVIKGVLAVAFTYAFASLAIDSGSYWHYLFTLLSLAIAINALGRLSKDVLRNKIHESKKK